MKSGGKENTMSFITDYDQRTAWKYQPIQGTFHTHPGLTGKVRPDGTYAPFPGSTVVFRAGRTCRQVIDQMQRVLFHHLNCTQMLADPLPVSTVHMTLHDLISPETASGSKETYEQEVEDSLLRAAEEVENIRKDCAGRKIMMTPDRIVNMVSKSLVLLLRPQTEEDGELLEAMYHRFDGIRALPYPLTPHITLAYFKQGVLDGDMLGEAVDLAQIRQGKKPVFEFDPEALTAQRFSDMQTYRDIPARLCVCCDGGLNRSVLAANILNHMAKKRNLPLVAEARACCRGTEGRPVPDEVWKTLEEHGICPDKSRSAARYLEEKEVSWFTGFAGISEGALNRFARVSIPDWQVYDATRRFFGVRDPEYGAITCEQAFEELYERAGKYLDAFQAEELKARQKESV